jgi:hypothetical protein
LLLPVVAGGILLVVLARFWPLPSWVVGGAALLLVAFVIIQLRRYWHSDLTPIARRLDRRFAELEDSTGLLLRESSSLNLLESLQQQRVSRRLEELQSTEKPLLPVDFRPALGEANFSSRSSYRCPSRSAQFPRRENQSGGPGGASCY